MEKNNFDKSCESGSCWTKSCISCKSMMPWIMVVMFLVIWGFAYFHASGFGYDRGEFIKKAPTSEEKASDIPTDADIRFKAAQGEVHAMKQDGMKAVASLYPDLAFVKSIKNGATENVAGMGDEDWLYSKDYDTTVIVCKHMNTPTYVFRGQVTTTEELQKAKTMVMEMTKAMKGEMPMAEHGMMTESDSMMPGSNLNHDGSMMKLETGYQDYSESLLSSALKEGQKVAIFFHASWCPNCRALEENIQANLGQIPANTLILKADYDSEVALKQKYGVTMQTTVVILNSDGSLEKKILGPSGIAEILR